MSSFVAIILFVAGIVYLSTGVVPYLDKISQELKRSNDLRDRELLILEKREHKRVLLGAELTKE